jgi:hypothetical protein
MFLVAIKKSLPENVCLHRKFIPSRTQQKINLLMKQLCIYRNLISPRTPEKKNVFLWKITTFQDSSENF